MQNDDAFFTANPEGSIFDHDVRLTQTAAAAHDPHAEQAGYDFRMLVEAARVVVPEGEHMVHVKVTPGEVVELPFGPEAHCLARLGDGNLAIKVGDTIVILEGYVAAAAHYPPVVESADGKPLDIASLLAATDPALEIQTAAGPGGNGGEQGHDNTGAIFQQFSEESGLGGFTGAGGQGDSGGPGGFGSVPDNSPTHISDNEQIAGSSGSSGPGGVTPHFDAQTDEDTGLIGQFPATNVDGSTLTYAIVGPMPAGLTLDPNGIWRFEPSDHYDSLQPGEQTAVSFQYSALDGFGHGATETFTIGVSGLNDHAGFTGDVQLGIVENITTPVSGQVVVHDLDHDQAAVATTGDFTGKYGIFHVEADGHWSYTLDNANPLVDQMHSDEFTIDNLTIKSIEGTEQVLSVKIDGANDRAALGGDFAGSVTEDLVATATSTITVQDPDHDEAAVQAGRYISHYGELDLNSDGTWKYTLDDSKAEVKALGDNDTVEDKFFVTSADGTATEALVIAVHGHNDAPVARTESYIMLENKSLVVPATGTLINDTDVEGDHLTAALANGPAHGALILAADGSFTYTPDNGFSGINDFTYKANDGTTVSAPVTDAIKVQAAQFQAAAIHSTPEIHGTAAHETVFGGSGSERIDGGGGNDLIFGNGGDDAVIFHDGDRVQGGDDSIPHKMTDLTLRGDILAVDHDVDFTKLDLAQFGGIETISLKEASAGEGTAQALTIGASDVSRLSDHTVAPGGVFAEHAAIQIDIEAVGQLYLSIAKDGGAWTQSGTGPEGSHIYTHETVAGDADTTDAYVVVHSPTTANIHLNQDAHSDVRYTPPTT